MRPHEAWLEKSLHDLKTSKILFKNEEVVLDTAIYHTQQCAEKALKAYLSYCNNSIIKTHDLIALNDICVKLDKDFLNIYDHLDLVNPYDTQFRYPGDFMEPSHDEVLEAIESAEQIFNFIKDKIK